MKKITRTISALLVCGAALLVASCGNKEAEETETPVTAEATANQNGNVKIAFVLIDTLTNQYTLYKEVSEDFQKKQANAETTINEKGKSFAAQVQEFQRKAQNNQFTQQQYEAEQARLQKLQQDIEALQGRLSTSLQEEYQQKLQALTDTIQNFMKSYAKEKGYDYILCKSSGIDNVLYGNESFDITEQVVKALNKRHSKYGKEEKKSEK